MNRLISLLYKEELTDFCILFISEYILGVLIRSNSDKILSASRNSVIEGSYQINLEQSNQVQEGYILYSFAPTAPPGFLIVQEPTNPVYMKCHNDLLTRINFRLTDQSNNLIDLRGEVLSVSLFVKS